MISEAAILHRAMFPGIAMPPELEARYAQARASFFENDAVAQLVARIVERELDAEAIEYALRLRHGPNGLTRRLQVMASLCEVRREYDGRFVQRRAAPARAWVGAPLLALRAAWKLCRGIYLCRVHGLNRFRCV